MVVSPAVSLRELARTLARTFARYPLFSHPFHTSRRAHLISAHLISDRLINDRLISARAARPPPTPAASLRFPFSRIIPTSPKDRNVRTDLPRQRTTRGRPRKPIVNRTGMMDRPIPELSRQQSRHDGQ